MDQPIAYATGPCPPPAEVAVLYRATTLGARRPIDDPARLAGMCAHANLCVSARSGGQLVGFARAFTDITYVTYLADLAVHEGFQRRGIGLELVRLVRAAAPQAMIVLLAAPQAVDYYPRIGFTRHDSAWLLRPGEPLPVG